MKHRPVRLLAASAAALCATTLATGVAQAQARSSCVKPVRVFGSPPASDHPFGITAGPGGTWDARGNRLDLIPADGGPTEHFALPDPASDVGWLASRGPVAPVVWFADRGTGELGYLSATIAPHAFRIPAGPSGPAVPQAIVFAAHQQLYFTDQVNDRVGRFDPATKAFTFWTIPTPDSQPVGLVRGPDGDLYFTERAVDKVGRLDPGTGGFTEWTLAAGAFPNRLAVTPDGNVWFTELRTSRLGRIDPSGRLHEQPTVGGPVGILYSDGFLYAADSADGQLVQYDLTGAVTRTWTLPDAVVVLQVAVSEGHVWVTDGFGTKVYRVDVSC